MRATRTNTQNPHTRPTGRSVSTRRELLDEIKWLKHEIATLEGSLLEKEIRWRRPWANNEPDSSDLVAEIRASGAALSEVAELLEDDNHDYDNDPAHASI